MANLLSLKEGNGVYYLYLSFFPLLSIGNLKYGDNLKKTLHFSPRYAKKFRLFKFAGKAKKPSG